VQKMYLFSLNMHLCSKKAYKAQYSTLKLDEIQYLSNEYHLSGLSEINLWSSNQLLEGKKFLIVCQVDPYDEIIVDSLFID